MEEEDDAVPPLPPTNRLSSPLEEEDARSRSSGGAKSGTGPKFESTVPIAGNAESAFPPPPPVAEVPLPPSLRRDDPRSLSDGSEEG